MWGSQQRDPEKASAIQEARAIFMSSQPQTPCDVAAADRSEPGLVGALLLACAIALSPNVADADLWGHVWYGRDALRHGLPATTTYSFTAQGFSWVNHENLFEVAAALGADTLGPVGLLVVKTLLGVGVVGLILLRARAARVGLLAAGSLALLVAVNLTYHWSLRPQLFTYVNYALLLSILSWSFAGWEGHWWFPWPANTRPTRGEPTCDEQARPAPPAVHWRRLSFVPLLFVFWTNSHGGVVAGLAIYVAYLGCRAFEALVSRGRAAMGVVFQLAGMAVAAGLATLVNPYGWRLHRWLLYDLTLARPEITEWHPPDFMSPMSIPLWLILAAFAITVVFSRRPRDFCHLMILGLTLWQSLCHQRHIPFFAIAFGFWMTPHMDSVLKRFASETASSLGQPLRRPHWSFTACLSCAYLLLAFKLYGRWHDLPVQRSEYPVSAFQFMADHNLRGRMVVTYNWAQYAIAAFGSLDPRDPGILVSYDGRHRTCYPLEIGDLHFDLILGNGGPQVRYRSPTSPPFDPVRCLEIGSPNLVLINRFQPHSVRVMEQQMPAWVLLYQDHVAQLWGRAAEFDDPAQPQYLPPLERIVGDEPQRGSVTWPALPVRSNRPVQLAHELK